MRKLNHTFVNHTFANHTFANHAFVKMTHLLVIKHWAQPAMHRLPSASIVPRGFPEGRSCGTLGVDGRRCMGAVRHSSLPLCLAQLPPRVLRRTLGRVAVDTANSMTNEGTRAQHTCVDTTRSVALLIQEYGTAGWRSMRAVRLAPAHLASHAEPSQ